ncbi:hypothetical protein H6G76_26485 [Nostoc sp. FACHB-152]|nr:hypothetical protein [Nostoc sp. FACHB-152]MBD2471250.1 hypothetical protein [Nostoc sp. FACHB-145]
MQSSSQKQQQVIAIGDRRYATFLTEIIPSLHHWISSHLSESLSSAGLRRKLKTSCHTSTPYWDTKSASSSLNFSHCRFPIAVNIGMIAVIVTCAATGVILGSPQKYK